MMLRNAAKMQRGVFRQRDLLNGFLWEHSDTLAVAPFPCCAAGSAV